MPLFYALLLDMAYMLRPDWAFIHAFVRCLITIYGLYAEACWHLFMPLFDALLLYMAFMLRPDCAFIHAFV